MSDCTRRSRWRCSSGENVVGRGFDRRRTPDRARTSSRLVGTASLWKVTAVDQLLLGALRGSCRRVATRQTRKWQQLPGRVQRIPCVPPRSPFAIIWRINYPQIINSSFGNYFKQTSTSRNVSSTQFGILCLESPMCAIVLPGSALLLCQFRE